METWIEFWELIERYQLPIIKVAMWISMPVVAIAEYQSHPEDFPRSAVEELKRFLGEKEKEQA